MKSKSFFVLTDTNTMPPSPNEPHNELEARAYFGDDNAYINEDGDLVYTIVSGIHTNPDRVMEVLELADRFNAGALTEEEQARWDKMTETLPAGAKPVTFNTAVQELKDYADVQKLLEGMRIHEVFMGKIKSLLDENGEVSITEPLMLSRMLQGMSPSRDDDAGEDPYSEGY